MSSAVVPGLSRRSFLKAAGLVGGGAALGGLLAGCGAGGAGGGTGASSINFLADTREELTKLKTLEPKLKEKYGFGFTSAQMQETALRTKTGLELSAPSTTYSAVMLDFMTLPLYVQSEALSTLDEYATAENGFDRANYHKPFLDAQTVDGKLYGLPIYQDLNILMYRADLFEKYGLDVPDTLDDLREVAKELAGQGKSTGMSGIAMRGQRGFGINEWTWPTFLQAFGGSYYKDFPNDQTPVLDSPEAVDALTYYVDLLNSYGPEGVANYSYVEVQGDLVAGKTAMILDSATLAGNALNPGTSKAAGKLGFGMVPKGPGGRHPGFYSWSLVVPTHGASPKQGSQFVMWTGSPEVATEVGFTAPNQALEKTYDVPNYEGYSQSVPLVETVNKSLNLADPDYRPRNSVSSQVGEIVSVAISAALSGQATPAQALKTANEDATSVVKKAKLI